MSTGDILKELAAMRAHFELRFDQIKIEMKVEASQLKAEMKTEMDQLNRRMDDLAGRVVELGRQQQQNPVDGGEGQVNQDSADGAVNNAGDGAQNGQENDGDQQDAVSVKSEIDSASCQSDCDYGMSEDIVVKEELDEDSGTSGQQQSEEQALFQPVAGPSGISRAALKRPQTDPPRRSTRLANSQGRLNLAESSDTSDSDDEDETNSPSTKKARTTTTNKRRPCPHCSKMVTNLSVHLLTHTGERRHVCDQCSKAFAAKWNLTEHRRIHTGERPFTCQHAHCGRAFTRKCNLDEHLRRHRGETKHHCEQCGRRFVSRSELTSHRLYVHSTERPYRCTLPGCNYAAATKCALDQHLQTKKHQTQ